MTIFDLLFALLFLSGAGTLVVATVVALRGHGAQALAILARLGAAAGAYFVVLVAVSAFSPQRVLHPGDDQCSDDWCIAVQAVRGDSTSTGRAYAVTFRLSSRARRVSQRERFVAAYLRGSDGRRYDALADASAVPFDTLLQPGQAIAATRRFVVPLDATATGVVIAREGGGRFPGCCIIGDEGSLFHRRTIVTLH